MANKWHSCPSSKPLPSLAKSSKQFANFSAAGETSSALGEALRPTSMLRESKCTTTRSSASRWNTVTREGHVEEGF